MRTRQTLDREGEQDVYHLTIAAEDGGKRVSFTNLQVQVLDDNDNAPHFEAAKYRAVVSANSSSGMVVLKVNVVNEAKY